MITVVCYDFFGSLHIDVRATQVGHQLVARKDPVLEIINGVHPQIPHDDPADLVDAIYDVLTLPAALRVTCELGGLQDLLA